MSTPPKLVRHLFLFLAVAVGLAWIICRLAVDQVPARPSAPPSAQVQRGVAGSRAETPPTRQAAAIDLTEVHCQDYESQSGIRDLRILVDGQCVATTDAVGAARIPKSVDSCRFESATHGIGHLHLSSREGERRSRFRIRRSVAVRVLADSSVGVDPSISVRLDRQCSNAFGRDGEGVVQPMTNIVSLPAREPAVVQMVVGRWILSTNSGLHLTPYRVDVRAPGQIVVRADLGDRLSISGIVTDAGGTPCSGITVATHGLQSRATTTDDHGLFSIVPPRRESSAPTYLDIALGSTTWVPQQRVGPFASGDEGVTISLDRNLPCWLRVELNGRPVQAFSVQVFRSPQPGAAPTRSKGTVLAAAGLARIGDSLVGNDFLLIESSEPKLEVTARQRDLDPVSESAQGGRVVILRLRRTEIDITVADQVSKASIDDAVIELVDSPGGWPSLAMRTHGSRE